jgi:hypothetical protein
MLVILIACLLLGLSEASADEKNDRKAYRFYENFDDNPSIDQQMRGMIRPYLLPLDHPMKGALDLIFSESRAIENEATFANAGFDTLFVRPATYIRVARHPLLPDHLLKVYLDNETRQKAGIPGWGWLLNRCKAAKSIRKLIKKKNLQHFSVPDKWLYPLPATRDSQHPVILIVTEMNLVGSWKTRKAWKNATQEHLDELFCILSHGYASTDLINNIPYTQEGKFACIDTEHPKRKLKYSHIRSHLSKPMQAYWDELVKRKGKR